MKHNCSLEQEGAATNNFKWYRKLTLVSADNPYRISYFRSDAAVRKEQKRHIEINKYVIHPFSKFRAWYEVYLIYLYGSLLITKPIDAGFVKASVKTHMLFYRIYTMSTDVLCWADIILNFITGLEVKGSKEIELRPTKIAKSYVLGPYFIFDVLSSFPKGALQYIPTIWNYARALVGVISILSLLKIMRMASFVTCIKKSAGYFRIKSSGVLFLVTSILISLLIIHWMACLQFAIPKLVRRSLSSSIQNNSWFFDKERHTDLYTKHVLLQYTHCLFKSSAYILGIRIDLYKMTLPEEYMLALITYFVGKILIAFIWIILAVAILNSRLMDIKFLEIVNQLEEYMKQKQLPLNLRDRILQYFVFKYGKKFFKEQLITSLLPDSLRSESSLHACRSLQNVSLFHDLTPLDIGKIVNYLIPEIFLPNDTIIHAGTFGDSMYFLSSGTVAVYTRSGKEICHLQDGAYFGEISLILKGQLRLATVVALETSHVYRLMKKDLDKCLLNNKSVKHKILSQAEARLKETTRLEEEYKELLFEESFRKFAAHRERH